MWVLGRQGGRPKGPLINEDIRYVMQCSTALCVQLHGAAEPTPSTCSSSCLEVAWWVPASAGCCLQGE